MAFSPYLETVKNKIKIVIADDRILFRKWLRLLLGSMNTVEISAEADNGFEAVKLAAEIKPDLVILDYEMPVMNGVEAAQIISRELPDTMIVMLTVYKDSAIRKRAIQAGVNAFLAKDAAENEIIKVIGDLGKVKNDKPDK